MAREGKYLSFAWLAAWRIARPDVGYRWNRRRGTVRCLCPSWSTFALTVSRAGEFLAAVAPPGLLRIFHVRAPCEELCPESFVLRPSSETCSATSSRSRCRLSSERGSSASSSTHCSGEAWSAGRLCLRTVVALRTPLPFEGSELCSCTGHAFEDAQAGIECEPAHEAPCPRMRSARIGVADKSCLYPRITFCAFFSKDVFVYI